jgi:hypothetical protein
MADGDYVEGMMTIIGGEYDKFMRFAKACDVIEPVVCKPTIWASISAALVTAATLAGGGVASWATGGGMTALMVAIPSIVCPVAMAYSILPKDLKELSLDDVEEFADDPYFKGGYKADTEKRSIRMLVSGAEGRVKDGFGLQGKELVKPAVASPEERNNYTRYLLGLKAQQKQDEAIEGIQTKLAGMAKKKSEEAPDEEEAAAQQEHMIYERWQLIAGINKRVI